MSVWQYCRPPIGCLILIPNQCSRNKIVLCDKSVVSFWKWLWTEFQNTTKNSEASFSCFLCSSVQVALPMLDQAVKIETMVDGGSAAWFQQNSSPSGTSGCLLPTPAGSPKVSSVTASFITTSLIPCIPLDIKNVRLGTFCGSGKLLGDPYVYFARNVDRILLRIVRLLQVFFCKMYRDAIRKSKRSGNW